MRNYIITGACGHLAKNIILYLKKTSCRIFGLILPSESAESDTHVVYYKGDVTIPESLDPIFAAAKSDDTVVIHAAGIISIADKVSDKLYDVNVNGTANIIEKCRAYDVRRLLYVSSVHAIPEKPHGEIITEIDRFSADLVVGGYAKTKAMATEAVMKAINSGLDAVIVHPSGIIGMGDNGNNHANQFVMDAVSGKLPAGVQGGYDFVDVRDVAGGCVSATEHGKKGECYILSGEYCTVKQILAYIRELTGGKKLATLPMWMAKMMIPPFEWYAKIRNKRPLFTRYSLYTLQSNARFSHEKATAAFGYQPRPIRDTVKEIVERIAKQANPVVG